MPTLESVTVHQLAALIAVEREASDRYRTAMIETRDAVLTAGTRSARYRLAAQVEHDAMTAQIRARVEVDQALRSLSVPRDGVAA